MSDNLRNRAVSAMVMAMLLITIIGTLFTIKLSYASSSTSNVQANVAVSSTCTLGLSNTAINFGSQSPGVSVAPTNAVFDANNGNLQGYLWLYGSNWILIGAVTPNFYVTNTIFSNTAGSTGEGAGYLFNALTIASANSGMLVTNTAPGGATAGNNLFFGINVPAGQAADSYSSNIAVLNTC